MVEIQLQQRRPHKADRARDKFDWHRGVSRFKTVRHGRTKFGQQVANRMRRRLERIAAKWYLDEVVLKISGVKHWLWRAVDQAGNSLVQIRRDATKRELRKLLKKQMRPPRVMIADKPARYGAANARLCPALCIASNKGLNNRAENSHQPTPRQERQIMEFKSTGQAQRFLFAHHQIDNLLHVRCPDKSWPSTPGAPLLERHWA